MRDSRFNLYFVLTLAASVLFATGCLTPEERRDRKMQATLRMHLSARANDTELRESVIIAGTTVYVERAFFLDERSVEAASVIEIGRAHV